MVGRAIELARTGRRVEVNLSGVTIGERRAAYAIGADGFHSAVRAAIGQTFPGR